MARVAFLGPPGTFTEEALLTQPDLAEAHLVPMKSMPDVLNAVQGGESELGFVALENSIEGTVNASLDTLIFDTELRIQREVVMAVRLNLLAPPGTALADVKRVVSFPHATAQCRGWLNNNLPQVDVVAANSTADAVQTVGTDRPAGTAALGTALAAKLYGLDVLARDVEDHPDNSTRFVLVARSGVPAPTGHDKTSIVCFQQADRPGSLHAILSPFSARNINLTKLESRPTKRGLGNYCFIIDLEGHIADEVVADCLRDLHSMLDGIKFLGSYPAAGEHGPAIRRDMEAGWAAAADWIDELRSEIGD
ncbi:MAG TPA: prephenate dehydratase [Acidimicrobiales bacterium]|nr:prephenate dehydratase [Acidimicrobiales bacterium]